MNSRNILSDLVKNEPLNGNNFGLWKRKISSVLHADKIKYVLTTEPIAKPTDKSSAEEKLKYEKWLEDDESAINLMLGLMIVDLMTRYEVHGTAKILYEKLVEKYESPSRTQTMQLLKKYTSQKMAEDSSIVEHISKMVAMARELIIVDELIANAAYIGTPGKGILAADESTGTIGKRLSSINVENVESSRKVGSSLESRLTRVPRSLLEPMVRPPPRVLMALPSTANSTIKAGARFAKWRAMLKIGPTEPSQLAINENANGLDRYAIICQANGLVPLVEAEILVDGPHDIDVCADVTECVLAACCKALNDHHVTPEVVAEYTVRALQPTMPAAVSAVVFLSGGQSEEEATLNLYAMNKLKGKKPWNLSFSFGWALQQSTLKAWSGKEENVKKAQAAFLKRCKANLEATLGTYKGDAQGEGVSESLHVKDYKY
ncbi:hypothetical protein HHK36_019295 [Tetracentron sinense]|uniref:fructose-bisphosphate aldolase n=1 Tax=Tetracentron sinense TaxID=13715 RepID=A0A834YTL8_TETSI|nr:hypothetical protein HHK36_019295 [Tetracentron sinense]